MAKKNQNKTDWGFTSLGPITVEIDRAELLPWSTIVIGSGKGTWKIKVQKRFNWFQKKMLKWCFGFEVKEGKNG